MEASHLADMRSEMGGFFAPMGEGAPPYAPSLHSSRYRREMGKPTTV